MLVCECGFECRTNGGMANHRRVCDVMIKTMVYKCNCGYESKWKSHLFKHVTSCKKQYFNPNINYIFEPHLETIDQMEKHQANMVELLDDTSSTEYNTQLLQSKLLNEQIITTKYIKQWKQQES